MWERAGLAGYPSVIDGTRCFCEDVNLNSYKKIPAEWRCDEIFPIYPLILEYTITSPNGMAGLPISGNVNCTVDWGDGLIVPYTVNNPTHRYTNAGTYIVSITGSCDSLHSDRFGTNLTKVISWGDEDFGYTSLWEAFTGCTNLSSIPDDAHNAFGEVTNCMQMFKGCTNLLSIPEGLFKNAKKVTNFTATFYDCSGLTGDIPANLFTNCIEATNFHQTFYSCSGLTGSIPENLFKNCTSALNFESTFGGCSGLMGSIPEDLFKSCSNTNNINSVFAGCSGLTGSIPENLFINNSKVAQLSSIFSGCTSLTGSIPEDLFKSCSNVVRASHIFYSCSGLTGSIPENLFANCPLITEFNATFSSCVRLTGEIPSGLFASCPEVNRFNGVFNGCTGLTSIGNNLFDNNKKMTVITTTFFGCVNLTGNTPTGLDGIELWDRAGQPGYPASVQGNRCFEGCTKLTNYAAIPRAWKQFN